MRFMYRMAPAVFALVLAICAVTASSALASEWKVGTPEWQQGGVALSTAAVTTSKGTVKLTDEGTGVTVECEAAGEGAAGPTAAGEETKWAFSKCVTQTGNCAKPELFAFHLPWNTELSISAGTIRDSITSKAGLPGYKLVCTVSGTKIEDQCTASTLKMKMKDVASGVEASLESSPKLNCSVGGSGKGKVEGSQVIQPVKGAKLEVVPAGPAHSFTNPFEVTSTGKVTVKDTKQGYGVTCEVETKGTVEALGKGTITSYSMHNCTGSGCTLTKIQTIGLPWDTELYPAGGFEIRDRIVSSGTTTPALKFECENGVEDQCQANTSARIGNEPGGTVKMEFDSEGSKTYCTAGGTGSGELQGKMIIAHPETVGSLAASR